MKLTLQQIAGGAFGGMSIAFAAWAMIALHPAAGALVTLPLLVCCLFVFGKTVRPLVVAGALALPYLSVAIVEIIATAGGALLPVLALALGVVFLALLAPVTRNAKLAAAAARTE